MKTLFQTGSNGYATMPPETRFLIKRTLWVVALLLVLGVLVWGQTLGFRFVWDDYEFIVMNPAIRSISYLPRYFTTLSTMAGADRATDFVVFRPLRNISYLFDFSVAGLDPAWWHAHNVTLHLINVILLFLVARRLLRNTFGAFVASTFFLLHPVQTEAVCWVKCRDDLLAVMYVLVMLYLWLRWRDRPSGVLRTSVLCVVYLLACLSKVQAIIAPALILSLEYWLPHRSKDMPGANPKRSPHNTLPVTIFCLLFVSAIYLAWRHLFIGRTSQTGYLAGNFISTMLTMTRVGVKYLAVLLWPPAQVADYAGIEASHTLLDVRVLASLAILLGILFATVIGRRRFPLITLGILWFALCLAPVSNVIPTMQYMAERFMYFPMIGISLLVGALFSHLNRIQHKVSLALFAVLIAILSTQTLARSLVWSDSTTLFRVTVDDTPKIAIRPRRNLLTLLINNKEYEEAMPLAEELWETWGENPSQKRRHRAEYAHHLGTILIRTGHEEEGLPLLQRAVMIDPTYAAPYIEMGLSAGQAGDHERALEWFSRASQADPTAHHAHFCAGVALRKLGRMDEAETALRMAIEKSPMRRPNAHKSLAALLWAQGRLEEAVAVYSEAHRLWPVDDEIAHWLAVGQERLKTSQQ